MENVTLFWSTNTSQHSHVDLSLHSVFMIETLLFGSECVLAACLCLVYTHTMCPVCTDCEVLWCFCPAMGVSVLSECVSNLSATPDRVELSIKCFGWIYEMNENFPTLPGSQQDYHWPRSSVSAHRVGLHGVEHHLVGFVQVMSAVHLALKARLFLDRVVRAELWRDHPQHWGETVREDKRLEYRPTRVRVGCKNGEKNRKEREED